MKVYATARRTTGSMDVLKAAASAFASMYAKSRVHLREDEGGKDEGVRWE